MRLIASILLVIVLFSCSESEPKEIQHMDSEVYMLSEGQLGIYCSCNKNKNQYDENGLRKRCSYEVILEDFDQFKYKNEIVNTTEDKWIQLLKSDTLELAHSASQWLLFLSSKGKRISMLELVLDHNWGVKEKWGRAEQKREIQFWRSYFKKN